MQHLQQQQPQRESNSSVDTLFKLSRVVAAIISVLYAPDLHELTRDYIANKITANYGADFAYWGVLAWWAALFGLTYYSLTFIFQSGVTFLHTAWYARNF